MKHHYGSDSEYAMTLIDFNSLKINTIAGFLLGDGVSTVLGLVLWSKR